MQMHKCIYTRKERQQVSERNRDTHTEQERERERERESIAIIYIMCNPTGERKGR